VLSNDVLITSALFDVLLSIADLSLSQIQYKPYLKA